MANADQLASAGVYITDAVGVEVTDGVSSRVQLGKIASGYGLRVVSSDGTTVIIDGTSDVFKISASGTATLTEATGAAAASTTVVLSSLGTFTSAPACLPWVSTSSSGTVAKLPALIIQPDAYFVATTSGGSPTKAALCLDYDAVAYSLLDGSSFCNVVFILNNWRGLSTTVDLKYYILAEAAM